MIGNKRCTPAGTNNTRGTTEYGSKDFKAWYEVGCNALRCGDCPTFFPLPPLTPSAGGSSEAAADADRHVLGGALPTHVHKAGQAAGVNDGLEVGTWVDGTPRTAAANATPGTWTPHVPLYPAGGGSATVALDDPGATHASKDFWDPVRGRRVMWVWAKGAAAPHGAQTVPREVTFDPRTGRLNYLPVRELVSLRSAAPVGSAGRTVLGGGSGSGAGPRAAVAAGPASDTEMTFERPAAAATIEIAIGNGTSNFTSVFLEYDGHGSGSVYATGGQKLPFPVLPSDSSFAVRVLVDKSLGEAYVLGGRAALTFGAGAGAGAARSLTLTVSATPGTGGGGGGGGVSEYMPGLDLPGHDYSINNTFGRTNHDPHTCEAVCKADAARCKAWTFVDVGASPKWPNSSRCCLKSAVGRAKPKAGITSGVPGAAPAPTPAPPAGPFEVVLSRATAWAMASAMVSKEQVLATPRPAA